MVENCEVCNIESLGNRLLTKLKCGMSHRKNKSRLSSELKLGRCSRDELFESKIIIK